MTRSETLDPDSSLWHWIAVDLRYYRVRHSMTGTDLGDLIGCTRQTISSMEAARPGYVLDLEQARKLDAHFELNAHFQRLIKYARAGHSVSWFREHLKYESRATQIKSYELGVVPGLLQSESYARALFASEGLKNAEEQVAARMARQERLQRHDAPLLWVLLAQAVLMHQIGGKEVLKEQLVKLLEVSELHNVILRVVPWNASTYEWVAGAFKVLTVEGGHEVAYSEAWGGGRLIQGPSEAREFAVAFDRIGAEALSPKASYALIRATLEALG